jgi:carbamoyl-phosphate synthase large subunit
MKTNHAPQATLQKPKKVLVLGSGSLKIGEAGEFDYSGSQCLKALREEGVQTVLVNPNIATIQTSKGMADKTYLLPVTPFFVEKVIQKEKPDAIFLSFGGQTALNCGVKLEDLGILKKHNVRVLGTPVSAIKITEDRELFANTLRSIGLLTPKSLPVTNEHDALQAAKKIGYPVMVRAAYALGGLGSGVCKNETALKELAAKAFSYAPQIVVEEYLGGWKEVEYEIVRDACDNCITVCNMENVDPMGIHTGESIVVAPSQTLTNSEYHKLRGIAIKLIRHLGIVGECNIQYALDPHSEEYRIIEVNARLSRSSALASKATGYPLAFVAAKLGLGYALPEIRNSITQVTAACFEPALDYIVLKYPRWDLKKFRNVSTELGSEMKSVGEVMAIGRTFEEVLQKALRMLGQGLHGLTAHKIHIDNIDAELRNPTDRRMLAIGEAFRKGYSIDKIYEMTKIDRWFLHKIKNIIDIDNEFSACNEHTVNAALLKKAKQAGFSDFQIARALNMQGNMHDNGLKIREVRKTHQIVPVVKQIDTLAGEFPAKTNYLYLTYSGAEDDMSFEKTKKAMVLGGGPYSIGSSVEFDWCAVNAVFTLKQEGFETIMVNYNPETVSTDYDICDKLYFDELSFERILDIYEKENPDGLIISMGGQIPNRLAIRCHTQGLKVLGTSPVDIDKAENRHKFSQLCDSLGIDQPAWTEASSIEEAERFAKNVGYPVLIRPSYVLSGAAMSVATDEARLEEYLQKAAEVSKEHPVVVSKFIMDAKEIEIDAVAQNGEVKIYAISEHIENAGVHSGDATMVLPPYYTYIETVRRMKEVAKKIAKGLNITGPFNIQFIAKDNEIKVIECNVRASRSFPFVSKVTGYNFIELATKAMLGKDISGKYNTVDLDHVGVKAPQFSFTRLKGADPVLSVEMASTGEVGCLGMDLKEAFLKSLLSVGHKVPEKGILLSTGPIKNKAYLLSSIKKLSERNIPLYATKGTHDFLKENTVYSTMVHWPDEQKEPNALSCITEKKVDLVLNIPKSLEREELTNDYLIRRKAIDSNIPLITNAQLAKTFFETIATLALEELEIKAMEEY